MFGATGMILRIGRTKTLLKSMTVQVTRRIDTAIGVDTFPKAGEKVVVHFDQPVEGYDIRLLSKGRTVKIFFGELTDSPGEWVSNLSWLSTEEHGSFYYIDEVDHANDGDRARSNARMIISMTYDSVGRYADAAKWMKMAAELGDPEAQAQIGIDLYQGKGVSKDDAQAVEWLRKAAKQGVVVAQDLLATVLVTQDRASQAERKEAMEWFRTAAEQGEACPEYLLGVAYNSGKPKDPALAVDWFRRAADQGLPVAEVALGKMYCQGESLRRDYQKGMELFQEAAKHGSADAEVEIGTIYVQGSGLNGPDPKEALRWFRRAAAKGSARAFSDLGVFYWNDQGVEKDPIEAYAWLTLAMDRGEREARDNRTLIAKEMTPEQIAKGERLAKLYQAGSPASEAAASGPAAAIQKMITAESQRNMPRLSILHASASDQYQFDSILETRGTNAINGVAPSKIHAAVKGSAFAILIETTNNLPCAYASDGLYVAVDQDHPGGLVYHAGGKCLRELRPEPAWERWFFRDFPVFFNWRF
ncbi:MAG: tetratricopeptide repeat protein [Limisphaerales bacterium]